MSTVHHKGLSYTMDVSTPQRPLLHLDGSTKQGPELQLAVSGQQEPVQVWGHVYTIGARAAPGRVYISEAFAAPRHAYATGALRVAAPGLVWKKELVLTLDMFINTIGPSAAPGRVYTTETFAAPLWVNKTGTELFMKNHGIPRNFI